MTIDAKLLRDTLELAFAQDDSFPGRFYEILFARHPELRDMFHRNSSGAQRKMFAQKLTAIIDHIEDPAWVEREVVAVARTHAEYGATAEMYPMIGDAIIQSLREACGGTWSDEAEQSWREAYTSISDAILRTSIG